MLGATVHLMRDIINGFIALFGSTLFAWNLIVGWKSGEMEAKFVRGHRVHSPVRFWLCTFYNVMFLAAGLFFLGNSLGLYRL